MTFATTSNCNTVRNIYVKTCMYLGSLNRHSDFVNKYSSNHSLKMAPCKRKHDATNCKHNC